ncbi:MAG TPA: hypothetical protein VFB62_04720, partial [Polyangiaceae bacterium]|nr:hypothetical protein [Polyangiaceae bacterium]
MQALEQSGDARRLKSGARVRATAPLDDETLADAGHSSPERTNPARRLDTVLRALPEKELHALIERMRIRIDTKKRIDVPAQVARALARLPDLREPSRLPATSAELLRRIAEAGGS